MDYETSICTKSFLYIYIYVKGIVTNSEMCHDDEIDDIRAMQDFHTDLSWKESSTRADRI